MSSAMVGRNIRACRQAQGLSAEQVAEGVRRHGVGLSRSALSMAENGHRRITVDELLAVASVLRVKPKRLLRDDGGRGVVLLLAVVVLVVLVVGGVITGLTTALGSYTDQVCAQHAAPACEGQP